jgi:hypothetical protein
MAEPAVVVVVPPQAKPRSCLRCDRRFLSEGHHHRLCKECRESMAREPTPEEEYSLVLHTLT